MAQYCMIKREKNQIMVRKRIFAMHKRNEYPLKNAQLFSPVSIVTLNIIFEHSQPEFGNI